VPSQPSDDKPTTSAAGTVPDGVIDPGGAAEPAAAAGERRASVGELAVRAGTEPNLAIRSRLLGQLGRGLAVSAKTAGIRAVAGGRWLAEELADTAPKIPVRDAATLRDHHPGRTDDEIAQALLKHAALATAGIGAAAGALASAEFFAPPTLLAAPVQLAAETLAVAAIEVKLVAELHELAGQPAPGSRSERGGAYLMSWVRQRAVDPTAGAAGLATVLGNTAKRELRVRLMRRLGRNVTSLAPLLAGAVAGAEVNRRATKALGEKLVAELRGRDRKSLR
jgi:hypothetical protein